MKAIIQLCVHMIQTALRGAEVLVARIDDTDVKAAAKRALDKIHSAADEALAELRITCPEATDGVTLLSGGTGKGEP